MKGMKHDGDKPKMELLPMASCSSKNDYINVIELISNFLENLEV